MRLRNVALLVIAVTMAAFARGDAHAAAASEPLTRGSPIWRELEGVYAKVEETGRDRDLAGRMALVSPDYTATREAAMEPLPAEIAAEAEAEQVGG